jgi:hypothetical protein
LGYGVRENAGSKYKLPPLSPNYVKARKRFKGLASTTTPKKSNLTRTGQLLLSMDVVESQNGRITITPTGIRRDEALSNLKLAGYLADKGRTFNRLSKLELNQIDRYYRRTIGDLLKKRRLLRS